jgi:hypothetical protein
MPRLVRQQLCFLHSGRDANLFLFPLVLFPLFSVYLFPSIVKEKKARELRAATRADFFLTVDVRRGRVL